MTLPPTSQTEAIGLLNEMKTWQQHKKKQQKPE